MSQRSDSRGSPAANSTRLALRTCSMVATRTASLSRCVLRCFGSRFASSALMPSVQTTIPFTWAMARSHVRANTESLHHTQLRPVNSSSQKLMDGEDRGPYLHRFHGVLPARDAQAVHEGAGARPHPTCHHRKTGCHPNDRRPSEYDGWAYCYHVTLYRTGERSAASSAAIEARIASSIQTEDHRRGG